MYNPGTKEKLVHLKLFVLYKISSKLKEKLHPLQNYQTKTNLNDMIVISQPQAKLFNELLISLDHPYVSKYDLIDINFNENYILTISGYSKDGSLKDLIYDCKPFNEWNKKYQYNKKKGLSLNKVKEYSKQIINSLLYLKSKRLPPVTDLHSGNLIMANNKKRCLLSSYEYPFIGAQSSISMLFNKNIKKLKKYEVYCDEDEIRLKDYTILQEVKEIICLGHVVYEMLVGCELAQLSPLPRDLEKITKNFETTESTQIIKFLNFIFLYESQKTEIMKIQKEKVFLPCLDLINSHPFLANIKLNEIDDLEINKNCQSVEMIEFIDYVIQKNKEIQSKEKKKKFFQYKNGLESKNQNNFTNISDTEKTKVLSSLITPTPQPPPPPPLLILPQQSISDSQIPSNELITHDPSADRSALLGDIRKGMKLKKAITNDKSKPKLK